MLNFSVYENFETTEKSKNEIPAKPVVPLIPGETQQFTCNSSSFDLESPGDCSVEDKELANSFKHFTNFLTD